MNRKVFVVGLALLVAAAGVVVWRGVRPASAGTVQPDTASLALLPAQATTVFGLDLEALRASPLYGAWRQKVGEKLGDKLRDKQYAEFVQRTGFDPERDLGAVTAGVWRQSVTPGRDEPVFLAVVTARYRRSSLSAFLAEKGGSLQNYRGFEFLGPEKPQHGVRRGSANSQPAVALVDDHTILAGSALAVKQALDRKLQPGRSVLDNKALLERVQKIGAENQLWAVSLSPGAVLPKELPPAGQQANVLRVLQGLESSTFALNATAGLRLLLEGTCANDEDARTLAEAARGLLAMLRLAAPADHPEALELLNGFQIEQQARQVRITGEVTAQLLDKLAAKPELFLPYGQKPGQKRPEGEKK